MGGSSGGGIVPFHMSALLPFLPSVFKGPDNAQGALGNQQMLSQKYPWITPAQGQFQGAQPGQFAGAGTGVPNPAPPVPPSVQPGGGAGMNQAAMAGGASNAMQPSSLQQILSVLMAGQPSSTGAANGQQS